MSAPHPSDYRPRAVEVTTLGEALVVLDPVSRGPLRHVGAFEKRLGGAEVNVAVALARLGHGAAWAGSLGDEEFGHEILAFLRGEGVDVSAAALDPESPTGVYFKEHRALDRLRVYYYRAGSAASRMAPGQFDLDRLLSGKVLHLTGITPALSDGCRELVEELIDAARERGVTVSFDANVRWRLFGEHDPGEVLSSLISRSDLVFLSEEEAELLLGCAGPDAVMEAARERGLGAVVVHGETGAFAVENGELAEESSKPVVPVDTVGAGDAFVAGFLSGRLRGWSLSRSLRLANTCGACAVTVPGDATSMPTEADALSLLDDLYAVER